MCAGPASKEAQATNSGPSIFVQNAMTGRGGTDASHAVTGSCTVSSWVTEKIFSHTTHTVTDDTAGVVEVIRVPEPDPHG